MLENIVPIAAIVGAASGFFALIIAFIQIMRKKNHLKLTAKLDHDKKDNTLILKLYVEYFGSKNYHLKRKKTFIKIETNKKKTVQNLLSFYSKERQYVEVFERDNVYISTYELPKEIKKISNIKIESSNLWLNKRLSSDELAGLNYKIGNIGKKGLINLIN